MVTAYHLVDPERGAVSSTVFVGAGQGVSGYRAAVVDHDAEEDLALLYICCSEDFSAARLATASPDDWIPAFSIGFGGQQDYARVLSSRAVSEPNGIHFDSVPLPGDSGSPVFDGATGEVVGILRTSIEFMGEDVAGGAVPPRPLGR